MSFDSSIKSLLAHVAFLAVCHQPSASGVPHLVSSSRLTRIFRYEASDFTNFLRNDSGRRPDTPALATSPNIVLTALAQLGVHQTGAQRALISLFDTGYEYIIAEATASTPLAPKQPAASCPDSLYFCGSYVPRAHWLGEQVFSAVIPPEPADPTELPLLLIDTASDPRCASKPLCRSIVPSQLYAAVPIRTSRGIDIGTYCVLSSQKIETWDDYATSFLRGVSRAIMKHLEDNRIKHTHRRNVRVSRGLASFLEQKATLSGWQDGPNAASFLSHASGEGILDQTQQQLGGETLDEDYTDSLTHESSISFIAPGSSMAGGPHDATSQTPVPNQAINSVLPKKFVPISSTISARVKRVNTLKTTAQGTNGIYAKAANIIREALEVGGCFLFDVTVGSYRPQDVQSPRDKTNPFESNSQNLPTSSSDEQSTPSPLEDADTACEILAFSTSEASSINAVKPPQTESAVPKRFLAKLLRRYPNGKIFSFDTVGELQSSDFSEDDSTYRAMTDEVSSALTVESADGLASTDAKRKQVARSLSRAKEGMLIQNAFPGARSVAFMPLWDVKRERWSAANFIYTLTPTRVFTADAELSCLNVFSKLIATEIHNMETSQSNQAKSDVLGSLSHELRSPLHGVVLGTELLNDTDLSVFQSNALHTIETCSRTLLDTIDHLLDYSKVNSFAIKRKDRTKSQSLANEKSAITEQFGKKSLHTNTGVDRLLEEVVESVFAGHSFQHASVSQKVGQLPYSMAYRRSDLAQAIEQLGQDANAIVDGGESGSVSVIISIDPARDWLFYIQAGAIRRIVMNLFGNSLKYTTRGTIFVSLAQEKNITVRGKTESVVKLVVQDTGKGISSDYLQHKLYQPFAQEDELAPGTGLGLSVVKAIVTQTRGRISVESQVGTGTKFTVRLPLERASRQAEPIAAGQLPEDTDEFWKHRKALKGLRVKCIGFEPGEANCSIPSARSTVETICREWLCLDLVEPDSANLNSSVVPDVVVWTVDALPESLEQIPWLKQSPNVIVCQNAVTAYQQFRSYQPAGERGAFEFISQPLGPRKLAKAIYLAYSRWMGLPKLASKARPAKLTRSHSSSGLLPTQARSSSRLPLIESVTQSVPVSTVSIPQGGEPDVAMKSPLGDINDKLLLVDDNHINMSVLSAYVTKLGLRFETASNGQEALDAYKACSGQFAAVLMDISMPVMNGFEATREIRAHEYATKSPRVVILALTGLASEGAQREALESGMDSFLTKPVRLKVLKDALKSLSILEPAVLDD